MPIWLGSAIELALALVPLSFIVVIIAECSRMTSMITPANWNAAVIIVNWRRDHEFVIIAPVVTLTLITLGGELLQ